MFPNIKKDTLYKLINDFIKNKRDTFQTIYISNY